MASTSSSRKTLARIIADLEGKILDASWRKETRLPSERELAASLAASRTTVREAIQRLVARGVLETRRGSGLHVSSHPRAGLSAPWLQLISESPPMRADTLEFRLVFECAASRFAAERATQAELANLDAILDRMEQAVYNGDVEAEALADAEFHTALAGASHNLMMDHFHASVIAELREHITSNTFDASHIDADAKRLAWMRLEQHRAIYKAVRARTPDAAFNAMYAHIDFVGKQFVSM
jgi:GntR family transcriptional repressor for pyruvate dehydrogenase complex